MSRAGRKRRQGLARQPNGQPMRSEAKQAEEAKAVVLSARQRLHGLSAANANEHLAGYAIGRMALAGRFGTDRQPAIDAVEAYVKTMSEYMRLKMPGWPMPRAMDYLAGKGTSLAEEPSDKAVARIEKAYEAYYGERGVLMQLDNVDRMIFHAVAFHDTEPLLTWKDAVVRCVDKLLRA